MNTLWIFNPDNDIALGNNLRNFTPPRNARLLRDAGAMLMSWIAGDGDYIAGSSPVDSDWLSAMSPILGKELRVLTQEVTQQISAVCPWGWSRAIVNSLEHLGISDRLMPDESRLDRIRELSHRRSSVYINRELMLRGIEVSMPAELSDIHSLEILLHKDNNLIIKSPWSSSGRGVIYSDRMSNNRTLELAQGIIRNQGSILVEPKLEKLIDFATLFKVDSAGVSYIGLSVFSTLPGGNYTGNIIASEDHLSSIITRYVDITSLKMLSSSLETILGKLIGDAYFGICGVDMMIYKGNDGSCHIAPCVELNLRTTMGYISHCLGRDIISPGSTGTMTVTYTGGFDTRLHERMPLPQFDDNNRLTGGSLSLIPENDQFDIRLTVNQ